LGLKNGKEKIKNALPQQLPTSRDKHIENENLTFKEKHLGTDSV
jgi:hypothetical protein